MNLDQTKAALSLHIGTPAQTNMSFGLEDSPSQGMLMSLPISEIDFFDKNPRRLHDVSSYEAIKESHPFFRYPATGTRYPATW